MPDTNEPRHYWIVVASRDHVKTGERGGFTHASHGKAWPLKKMKPGDWIIFYSSKMYFGKKEPLQRFTAIAQVKKGEVYQLDMGEGFKPYRRDVTFFPCSEVDIVPLIPKLTFIRKKESWGYVFRFGFFEIPQNDFDLIARQMIKDKAVL